MKINCISKGDDHSNKIEIRLKENEKYSQLNPLKIMASYQMVKAVKFTIKICRTNMFMICIWNWIYLIAMVFLFAILFCICYIVEHRFFLCTSICVYKYLTIDFLISSAGVFVILLIFFFMYLVSVISGQLSSSRTVRFSLAQGDKPRCRIPWKIWCCFHHRCH